MTERRQAIQTPADMSSWTREGVQMSDESQYPGSALDAETQRKMAQEQDPPPSEDDELKESLRLQQHADRFVVPDPSDHLSDEELWAAAPESITGGLPWRRRRDDDGTDH